MEPSVESRRERIRSEVPFQASGLMRLRVVYGVLPWPAMGRYPPRRHVIAFRVDDLEHARLDALRSTFSECTWRETFTWLFAQDTVVKLVHDRIVGGSPETELDPPPRHDRLFGAGG